MSSGCLPSFRGVWMILVILAVSGTLLEGRQMAPNRAFSSVDLPTRKLSLYEWPLSPDTCHSSVQQSLPSIGV